jgi:hypothetical protein
MCGTDLPDAVLHAAKAGVAVAMVLPILSMQKNSSNGRSDSVSRTRTSVPISTPQSNR